MPSGNPLDSAKWFLFRHFERILVVLLVLSLLLIHQFIDEKRAFLSFYYLPIITAGFFLGWRPAVLAAVLVAALVVFFQIHTGLNGSPGLHLEAAAYLVPWGGFLILTAYTVGKLAEQRQSRTEALQKAYVTLLEVLTFNLESAEKRQRGHSYRVSRLAVRIAGAMDMHESEVEALRVAALLHEIGLAEGELTRVEGQFTGDRMGIPVVAAVQDALAILEEYQQYHEHVALEWPADRIRVSQAAKILVVADAYETLQMESPSRPAFAPWHALEEIERSAGQAFGSEVVQALRRVASSPEPRSEVRFAVV
jgi:hypothetical protein